MKIAILTSPKQWFVPYAKELKNKLAGSEVFYDHKKIPETFVFVFILSYHRIIKKKYLDLRTQNIVIHGSDLPRGKGWAPIFWQILEGENNIPFTMLEAGEGIDDGDVYMKRSLKLTGLELNFELRRKQANFIIEMCLDFLENYDLYKKAKPQEGKETFYKKRKAEDSELNFNKSLKEQFNLLRIVDNEAYPAFFYRKNRKYIIKIYEEKK